MMANGPEVCNHPKWILDSHNRGTCTNPECGEVRQFPSNKGDPVIVLEASKCNGKEVEMKTDRPTNIKAKHKFYEDNKAAIIADLLHLGKSATRGKWRIPKGTLPRLIEKWLTPEQKATVNSIGLEPTTQLAENGRLPAFPEFSNSWEAPVQVKWLEIYEKLLEEINKEV